MVSLNNSTYENYSRASTLNPSSKSMQYPHNTFNNTPTQYRTLSSPDTFIKPSKIRAS
jgi:hypothetical protein